MYDLKALQKKELDILKAVHEVCEKLKIEYIIMYGTLIGAVRHKGFIPWDDDIDICMTRDSYDIFIKYGQQYLPENLRIQHAYCEKQCPNYFAKVRDVNTLFLHSEHVDLDINQGVFIDIFPIDRVKRGKIHIIYENLRRRFFSIVNECFDVAYVKTIKRPISKIIGYFIHYFLVRGILRGVKRNQLILKEEERRRKIHKKGDDCAFYSLFMNITGPYSLFTNRKLFSFENYEFYGPANYDYILSVLYGDYMKLPPKEKQVSHKPMMVDLNRGYSKKEIDNILKK